MISEEASYKVKEVPASERTRLKGKETNPNKVIIVISNWQKTHVKNCEILQQTVSGGIVSLMCYHSRAPKVFCPFAIMTDSEREFLRSA